uniref:Uncharacterized protein n=1 Tax=Glycine max TaxID=3847 RepID=A0A0R0EA51_SOYBN
MKVYIMAEATKPIINVDASKPTPPTATFAKSLPDVSKIEVLTSQNFRRRQERVRTLLDMHGVVFALSTPKPDAAIDANQLQQWVQANKRFIIPNYYQWTMNEEKDTKEQINEYHKLLEDLKPENISLLDEFISELLIEKLSKSWTNSKQQLKHRHKHMSLPDLIIHIITEDTNKKESVVARTKVTFAKANTKQDKPFHKKYVYKIDLNNKKNYKHNNLRDALSNPIPRAFTSNSSFEKK